MADVKIVVGAVDNATKVLSQVRSSLGDVQTMGAKLGGVLGTLGASFGAAAATAWVRSIVDGVDALNDLKDATGASIENISALEDVAARTGTSFDTVQASLLKFNQALNSAEPDSKTAQALKAIGLSAEELKAVDPAEALRLTAVALSSFADDGNKARLSQILFGKSLKETAPFLKDLAEQGKLVGTVTTEQAEAAEKFNKQLFVLQKNATDAARVLTGPLVTGLTQGIERFKLAYTSAGGFLEVLALYGRLDYSKTIQGNLEVVEQQISALEDRAKRITSDSVMKGNDKQIQDLKNQAAYLKALRQQKILNAQGDNSDAVSRKMDGSLRSVGDLPQDDKGAASALKAAASAAKRAQEDRIRAGRELATALGKAVEEGNDMYNKMVAEEARLAEADAKRTADYLRTLQAEVNAVAEGNQAMALQLQEIGLTTEELGALRLARMDDTVAQLEQTRATAYSNGLSYEEVAILEQKIELLKQQRELTAATQLKTAATDAKKDADRASKEFANTLRGDLKGAFSAAFRDTGGDPLKAFGDALENMMFTRAASALTDALIEAAAAQAASSFGSSGSGGGIGDFLSSLFSFDGGGSTGSGPRSGGLDGKGGFLSLLHPQETVIDHTKGQTGVGGGVTIVQNIQIDSRSDQATIMAAMHRAKEMAKSEILQSRARGGAFA